MAKPTDIPPQPPENDAKKGGFFQIYSYADNCDIVLLVTGVILSLGQGAFNSVAPIIFKDLTDALIEGYAKWEMGIFVYEDFYEKAMKAIWKYIIFGSIVFVSGFVSMSCWHIISERQVYKVRVKFFDALMRQEKAWYDRNEAGALTTKMSDGVDRIKDGTGDKLGISLTFIAQFVGGLIVSFSYSWKLSLVMLGMLPAIMLVVLILSFFTKKFVKREQELTGKAGSVAEEVVHGIRTVIAFNGQGKEADRYQRFLDAAAAIGVRQGLAMGSAIGTAIFLLFFSMGIAFWYGTKLVNEGVVQPGTTFAVFWAFINAVFSVAQLAPQIGAVAAAQNAAAEIFSIINKRPQIDSLSTNGMLLKNFKGQVTIRNLEFSYPSRPEVQVLKRVNLEARPGQVIALVGHSGSGKSTIVQLIQRFYDANDGQILFDDIPITDLNINCLRNVIGVVSQEPVIFSGTIEENLKMGKVDLTEDEMLQAAKIANALEFIDRLPDRFRTRVGDGGVQLSGGQKQRLVIARALCRDPKVLLLDEATSALDSASERLVQAALSEASKGRTTLVVAHRLSTVRHADNILVFEQGEVKEEGRHDLLMQRNGLYAQLVRAQDIAQKDDKEDEIAKSDRLTRSIRHRRSRRLSRALSAASANLDKEEDIDRLKEEVQELHADTTKFINIVRFARPEWKLLTFAIGAALLRGAIFPLFSIIYGQTFKNFITESSDERLRKAVINGIYFGLLGVFGGSFTGLSAYLFVKAGESITKRLRMGIFENILSQDGAYFDDLKHSPGRLTGRLSTDAPNVRAALDQRLADVVASFSAIFCGVVIAFSYSVTMAPVGILTAGLLVLIQTFLSQYLKKRGHRDAALAEEPSRLASEAIDKHGTVQGLTRETYFSERFHTLVKGTCQRATVRGIIQSLMFALQSSYVLFNFAIAYRYGIFLIKLKLDSPYTVFQVIEALNCATMTMLAFATYFPEYVRARLSASIIFKMMQDQPQVSSPEPDGKELVMDDWQFDSVLFGYPANKSRRVLNRIRFEIPQQKTVALVGHSGCGKSTIIQLLERYYDPDDGFVRVNGKDLREINLKTLRSQISLVGQEPILFNYTIKENIAYGMDSIDMSEVESSARLANAHDFIKNLPQGYDTVVGEKGGQLSGGQRQRIAIARAVIRQPRLLLLDEATSALDARSEKLVQAALDRASRGRTTVVVAHRLNTVRHADLILVLGEGRVVERGTHAELLRANGVYASLAKQQSLS